jgi:uncharacterized membrane-anchored protein
LLSLLYKGLEAMGLPIDHEIATGISVVPVLVVVAWGVRRIRVAIQRRSPGAGLID